MDLYVGYVEFHFCTEHVSALLYICELSVYTAYTLNSSELYIHFLTCADVLPGLAFKSWDVQASLEYITQLINNQARLSGPLTKHHSLMSSLFMINFSLPQKSDIGNKYSLPRPTNDCSGHASKGWYKFTMFTSAITGYHEYLSRCICF